LAVGSYRHSNRAYGKILVPEFHVTDWADAATVPRSGPDDADDLAPGRLPRPARARTVPGRQAAGAWPRPPTRSSSRVKPGECCSARRAALFRAITL
jgi:hypothetical protein